MLDANLIEQTDSPWSSPVVLTKKPDGSWRFAIDYRKLNEVTKVDAYPLPTVESVLRSMHGCTVFSSIDMKNGFHVVGLDDDAKLKSAFCTTKGLYCWNRLPFGMVNASATCQRMMDLAFKGLQPEVCCCYIDDVIIFSHTFEEHLAHLEAVFKRLDESNLRMGAKKCHFGSSSIDVLGHTVTWQALLLVLRK